MEAGKFYPSALGNTCDRYLYLAYNGFVNAEKMGFSKFSRSKSWLSDNEVLFGKAQWFMMDANVKNRGFVRTSSSCYEWVGERLDKQSNW